VSKRTHTITIVTSGMRVRSSIQRAAFASLYRFGGSIYDPLARLLFGDQWDEWRRSVLTKITEGPVLDVGCGTGALLEALVSHGHDAVGIDVEPSMLARAHQRALTRDRLIRALVSELPFESQHFAACVATFPSRYITEDASLDEIGRVLKTGGILAVVLTGQSNDRTLWRLPIRGLLRMFYGRQVTSVLPSEELLCHPLMRGAWEWVPAGNSRALLWVATKSESGELRDVSTTP
jgi:ubiquinone/menaquinone biosynthesis C-methylase UbiE